MPSATVDAVANVYARALFELALDGSPAASPAVSPTTSKSASAAAPAGHSRLEEVADELEQVVELARSDRRLREFLVSPIIDKDARSAALSRILGGRVSELTQRFLVVLNRKDRLGHLEAIQKAFDLLIQEKFGRVEVDVFTATAIEESQLESIKELARKALGKEPVMHRYVDPELLGGMQLRIGDRLVDASLAGRLNRMKESILTDGVHALRARMDKAIDERP